jgi:hypothetical protein
VQLILGSRDGSVSRRSARTEAGTLVQTCAEQVGLDLALFSGHSLPTIAAEHGAFIWKMMEVSRHTSVNTVRGHGRHPDLLREHAGP